MRTIETKKTSEINPVERAKIVRGFNQCFPKHVLTEEVLFWKYSANHYGESYHALCYDDDQLVGFISAIPFDYTYHNEHIKVGLTCDIFIVDEARADFTLFAKLYKSLKDICLTDKIVCFLGVANENAYTYSVRILRCKELFTLPFWILPVRAGNIAKKSWLKPLNVLSLGYAYLSLGINRMVSIFFNLKEGSAICRINVSDEFLKYRLPDQRYKNVHKEGVDFSYIITNDEGIKCAYIMLLSENNARSYKVLCKCVAYILRNENVDLIMFNGTLNLRQGLLIKTPQKFEPRKIHLTVNYLTKEYEKQYVDIMNPNGIDFTLLNLDVR